MDLSQRLHRRLLAIVGLIVLVTVGGLVALWPAADEVPRGRDQPAVDTLVSGRIVDIDPYEGEPDTLVGVSGRFAVIDVEVAEGPDAGSTVTIDTPLDGYPDLEAGDRVELSRAELADGTVQYFIVDFARGPSLLLLVALFVVTVLAVSRWHGLRSLAGLAISLVIIAWFVVPAILAGRSPFLVALFGALAVMVATLYLTHGVNERTTSAVIGTAFALAVTIVLGLVFIDATALTGFASEEANLARFSVEGLDLQGLVLAGLIIAALGVLDDVTVSQASTVFAIHDADPRQSWATVFRRAMAVGRDHIASTVNTLVLAYAGASLALLVVLTTSGLPLGELLTSEVVAEEIVKTLVGSLGLISAVPLTTALATTAAVRRPLSMVGADGGHIHHHAHDLIRPTGQGSEAHGEHPVLGDRPTDDLDDEERAYRSWVDFLRERPGGGDGDPSGAEDDPSPPDR